MDVCEGLKKRRNADFVRPENDGCKVVLSGFVKNVRILSKKLKFIILEDWTGDVQLTFAAGNVSEELLKRIDELTSQSVIIVEGIIKKSKLTHRGIEVIAQDMEILTKSAVPLPIDVTEETISGLDKRLDWRFLDLRNERRWCIFKILSDFERHSRDFFYKEGFIEIHTPKLMGSPSESGAEVFKVDYFGRKAYLAQSPQFYKQMAICGGFEKVFEIAPAFRANPSFTIRHDTEFTSLDIEMAYISSFEDLMDFEERWLAFVMKKLKENWGTVIKERFGIELSVPKIPFPRIEMQEAYKLLRERGLAIKEGDDIGTAGEKALSQYVKESFDHDFVFITKFPWAIRPFYHMKPKDKSLTCSFDLLWKGIEMTTGAQREHRYDILVKQAKEKGLNIKNIEYYLNFFKYGAPPHGGFGFSPTRFVMCLLDLGNVREATLVPRDPKRLLP